VVADVLRLTGWSVAGFVDDLNPGRAGESFGGATVLGGVDELPQLRGAGIEHAMIGVGDCEARLRLAAAAAKAGFTLPTAVHPAATVATSSSLGAGSLVAAAAVVGVEVRVGTNVIVNTGSSVDHECVIADGVHIGPGVRLAGLVRVGEAARIGIGSTVRDRVTIGARSFVGAGAVVVCDLPPSVLAYGVPARVIRGLPRSRHPTTSPSSEGRARSRRTSRSAGPTSAIAKRYTGGSTRSSIDAG
jgi:acetyltransferase EpsM